MKSLVINEVLPKCVQDVALERVLGGQILCVELWSGRYFASTPKAVNEAIAAFNDFYHTCGQASLNDLYSALGLKPTQLGYVFGWSHGDDDESAWSPRDIDFRTGWIKEDGKLVYYIELATEIDAPFEGWAQV